MSDAIETIEHKGHTIEIFNDDMGISPRDNDNMCIIHIAHRNFSFGDEHYTDGESVKAAEREAKAKGDIVLPLYMYNHSGVTIALTPFSCRWDSGQVGFVQVKKSEIIANWGKKNWTKKLRLKALEVAKGEVKELDSFINGEVYLYSIDDYDESCGGFIGDIKYCIDEAKSAVDSLVEHAEKEKEKSQLSLFK